MLKAIFFDAGDTLIRMEPSASNIFKSTLEENGIAVDEKRLRRGYAMAERFYKEFFLSTVERIGAVSKLSDKERRRIWIRYNLLILETLGIEENREALASAMNDRFEEKVNFTKFKEADDVLKKLSGYTLAIISNWNLRLTIGEVFERLDLTDYFSFLLASCDVGYDKPHPEIFRIALRKASVEAHEAIHIGDSYEADVMGARGSGIQPILLERTNHTNSHDCLKIRSLNEVFVHLT